MKTILCSFIFCLMSACLTAQPGTLDSNFGNNGKVISETYEGDAYASLLQPDGKIVVGGGGSFYKGTELLRGTLLVRYNTNGSPDLNFADSGRGVYILGDSDDYIPTIHAMALQPDGKIVALGNFAVQNGIFGPFSLMRFNTDGSPDENFGINGLVVCNITGGLDAAFKVGLLKDGRIVVAGQPHKDINDYGRGFIACYNQQGKFDRSFGDTGVVTILLDQPAAINSMAITADNKIIVGGTYGSSVPADEILLQYNNNGTPDLNFGENGMAKMSFSAQTEGVLLNDIAIDKEGRIVTAGIYYSQRGNGVAAIKVGRFTKAGFPDTAFSSDGYTYTQYIGANAYAETIAVQANNKIIAAGYRHVRDSGTFTIIRYNPNGSVDSAFGINGIQNTFFYGGDIAYSANIQKDGKIVLAGFSQLARTSFVDIARYNGDATKKQIILNKIKHYIQTHNNANAVADKIANASISVYPNPVNNLLTIKGLDATMNYDILMINDKGAVIKHASANNISSYQFNVQNLSSGVYYVSVISNQKIITTLKFVKQ
ncbi:MAG: T9SS type A sorting domain-containing protein [Parafilimonas sp.]